MSTHHPNFKRTSGFGSVFKSWTSSLKGTSANVPVQISPTVVGGGSDQQKLFHQLKGGSLPARANAAVRMTESLQNYTISSIPEVWYLARDMCDSKVQPQIRRTALRLLIECIKNDDLTLTGTVLMYYRDIVRFCQLTESKIDQEFYLFLKALRSLTQDGRDIADVCLFDIDKTLPQFLSLALTALGKRSKLYTSATSVDELRDDLNYQSLVKTLIYLKSCFKFNAHEIDHLHTVRLAHQVIAIGYQTTNIYLQKHCLELLATILVSTSIVEDILADIIYFFCFMSSISSELSDIAWACIRSISKPSNFFLINSYFNEVLSNENLSSNTATDFDLTTVLTNATSNSAYQNRDKSNAVESCVGAMVLIEQMVVSHYMSTEMQDAKLTFFLEGFTKMLSFNIETLNSELLVLLNKFFSRGTEASKLELSLHEYNQQVFAFQLWFSSKTSIYSLMKKLKVTTADDAKIWKSICTSLHAASENGDLATPKERLVDLFFTHHTHLPTSSVRFIISYFAEERLCSTLSEVWKENSTKLLNYFFYEDCHGPMSWFSQAKDPQEVNEIRLAVLKTVSDSLMVSFCFDDTLVEYDVVFDVFKKSTEETNEVVLAAMFEQLFVRLSSKFTTSHLQAFLDIFSPYFIISSTSAKYRILNFKADISLTHYTRASIAMSAPFIQALAKAVLKVLVIESTESPDKCQTLYGFVMQLTKFLLWKDSAAELLIIAKCLCRIRVTAKGNIYFVAPEDLGGLAAAFRRSKNESDFESAPDFEWVYPEEPDYLPKQYFEKPHSGTSVFHSGVSTGNAATLDMTFWFQFVLDVMENFISFEVYSFIWAHFCPQLSNLTLFMNNKTEILDLKRIVCQQLALNLPPRTKLPGDILKSDLQVAFVRTLSALLGYREDFSKYDEDDIIRALLLGIDSWEKTAVPCIHILTVCCYEIPLSIKKFLSVILTKLQTRISSAFASSHILEFLMNLINLPALTSNFNMDEVKRIFGIAFKFIQYSNDAIKKIETSTNETIDTVLKHGAEASTDLTPSTNVNLDHVPILLKYVLTLSYNVISTWFLQINLSERKQLSSFIIKNLIALNGSNKSLNLQAIAFLDLIVRFTYNDLPLKIVNPYVIAEKFRNGSSDISSSKWVLGSSIISIDTKASSGESLITIRRATGVSMFHLHLDKNLLPSGSAERPIISSPHFLLQMINHLDLGNKAKPVALIDDSITTRALSTFDRVPIVEFHKIGLIYIAPGQSEEVDVLRNTNGSKAYQRFLDSVGDMIRLKDCKNIYTGGLDTENNSDGYYTIYWKDKTVQVVYHVTTLMKNDDKDIYFDLKKRHIGNNYVNIYFDESGLSFNFNLIKSQFNFINIVITPHTKSFDAGEQDTDGPKFYKVRTLRRMGVPGVFATCHFKIISEKKLAFAIRNLAITANQFANVWHAKHGYTSNWVHRAKQISIIKERTVKTHQSLRREQFEAETAGLNATQSFLEQLDYSGSSNNNHIRYEYLSDQDSEMYKSVEFNSYC